jgi:hypothetical protein
MGQAGFLTMAETLGSLKLYAEEVASRLKELVARPRPHAGTARGDARSSPFRLTTVRGSLTGELPTDLSGSAGAVGGLTR